MNTKERLTDLLDVTERLNGLLETENAALKRYDAGRVRDLLEDKSNLARLYERHIRMIAKAGDLGASDGPTGKRLREAGLRLEVAMADNERLLRSNTESSLALLSAIRDAARDHVQKATHGYSDGGTMRAPARTGGADSVSVNTVL